MTVVSPSAEVRAIHDEMIVPKALRAQAYAIIKRMPVGSDNRGAAYQFVSSNHRTRSELQAFIERMTNANS